MIEITPKVFFDLFVLCLSWRWNPNHDNLMGCTTTVDAVVKILHKLNVLTFKQKKVLYKNKVLQGLFLMKGRSIPQGDLLGFSHQRLEEPRIILIAFPACEEMNRERLLRDYRILLTNIGKTYADSLGDRYKTILTREAYLVACEERDAQFTDMRAKAAAATRYRELVKRETQGFDDE